MKNNNETTSEWIDDKEFDKLISGSMERYELLEEVQHEVMNKVRSQTRREMVRKWMRMAAFAFGLPTTTFGFGAGIYALCTSANMHEPYIPVLITASAIAMLMIIGRAVRNFSLSEL
jgi:hypothetical protein